MIPKQDNLTKCQAEIDELVASGDLSELIKTLGRLTREAHFARLDKDWRVRLKREKEDTGEPRRTAILGLGHFDDDESIKALLQALNDLKWEVKEAAVEALTRIGEPAIKPLLQGYRNTDDAQFKVLTAWALTELGHEKGFKRLKKLAFEGPEFVISLAIDALGSIGDNRALKALLELYRSKVGELGESEKMAMVTAIEKIGDSSLYFILYDLLREAKRTQIDLWVMVARALKKLEGDSAFDKLYKQRDLLTLAKLGDKRAIPILIDHLNLPEYRMAAAIGLGYFQNPIATEPLVSLLNVKDNLLRQTVAKTLGLIGDEMAITPLIGLLKDKNARVRRAVVQALGVIGDKKAIPLLKKRLKDKDEDVRGRVISALCLLGEESYFISYIENKYPNKSNEFYQSRIDNLQSFYSTKKPEHFD